MLRKTAHWQKPCQSLGETRNLWIHPLQGRVSNRVGVFSTEPPHIVRDWAGQKYVPVQSTSCLQESGRTQQRSVHPKLPQTRPEPPVPRTENPPLVRENPTEEALKLLLTLPEHNLNRLGLRLQMDMPIQHANRPIGGRLAFFMANWEEVSNDPWVLEAVRSYKIEFISGPRQREPPGQIAMNAEQSQAMTLEIQELHKKGAVVQADSHSGGVVSQVFLVPKSDGAWRPVLNLKSLNQFVVPHHFKMESIRTLEGVLQKDDWLLKLDLKDAYLSIPIHQNHQHFLRFPWKGQLWQFKALPFGLSSAPWVFTKVTKPISSILRKLGIWLILYLEHPSYSVDINPLSHKNENRFTVNQLLSQRKRYLAHMFNPIRVEQKPVPSTFDCTSEAPDALRQHSQFAHSTQPAFLSCSFKRSELVAVGSEKEP